MKFEYTHGIEPEIESIYDSTSSSLESHLAYLYDNYDESGTREVWVTPSSRILEYIKTRDNAYEQDNADIVGMRRTKNSGRNRTLLHRELLCLLRM